MKKNKVLVGIIILLIISNLFFISKVKEYEKRDMYMLSRGVQNIHTAISEMDKLNHSWNETDQYYSNEYYKLFFLSNVNEYLGKAIENLNDGKKYFYPLKEYQFFLHDFIITMESLSDAKQVEHLKIITEDFDLLREFIDNNDFNTLSQDELLDNWLVFRREHPVVKYDSLN